MLVCGIDLETTGLDTDTDEIIEIGAVIWDTEKHVPVKMFSQLMIPSTKVISPEITKITGITPEQVYKFGFSATDVFIGFMSFASEAECFVAHNGALFDKPLLVSQHKRIGFASPWDAWTPGHWIDTSSDLPFPEEIKTRKLTHLAAEHGFLNPFAHRALFDVLTMLKIMSNYNFDDVLALSKEPAFVLQALCEKPWEDGGKSTDEAKANGFRWDGKAKKWQKMVRQSQLVKEHEKAKLYKVAEVL